MSMISKVLRDLRWSLRDVTKNGVLASGLVPPKVRVAVLKVFFGVEGGRFRVLSGGFIGSGPVRIGQGSTVNYGVFIDPTAGLTLGDAVTVGPRTMFITASHRIGDTRATRTDRAPGTEVQGPIVVGSHVWIGANVTVLPGVTIGDGCVVAAGAVVTGDCAPDGLYAGVPARRLRDLPA